MKTLFTILILTASLLAQYTTPGTGVNWNLDDLVTNSGGVVTGPAAGYEIHELVTIAENDKVTITDGTLINFTTANAGFEVNGAFMVLGTMGNMNTFTSSNADSTGSWFGIQFNDTADDLNCKIAYTKIQFASYGFRAISASPTLDQSHLDRCNNAVRLSGSNAVITNNLIERTHEYACNITLSSSPLIEGNIIRNNNTQATAFKNQISVGLQGINSPIIKNNKIYNGGSSAGGISIWVNGSTNNTTAEIMYNEIYNNAYGITLFSSGDGVIEAKVVGNNIYDNNQNPNTLATGSGININGSIVNTPLVSWNRITGNHWGITIMNGATVQVGPQPKLGWVDDPDTSNSGNNMIWGNGFGTETHDLYNNTSHIIYAQNNDWGTNNPTEIEDHIYHFEDDNAHGPVHFTPYKNTSVPVELSSFTASAGEGTVTLNWITATELNNKEFELFRNNLRIAVVEGNGTKTEPTNYSFTDDAPATGSNVYELYQIDFDGTRTLTASVEVLVNVPVKFDLAQNYPNPFNPSTSISFTLPNAETVKLVVYNMLGEIVTELVNRNMEAGYHTVNFNASELTSGAYIYQLNAGEFVQTRKMILMK